MQIKLKDGTGFMRLKHLVEDIDRHGNVRVYFRRGRQKVRMREELGTESFMAAYKAAFNGSAPAKEVANHGTLRWLTAEYYRSAAFARLDSVTRGLRRRQLDAVSEVHGENPISRLEGRHIRLIRDSKLVGDGKVETPHAANNLLKALRGLFKWAVDQDHLKSNPARDVSKIKTTSEGHHTWTPGEILQFMKRHPANTKAGLALALLFYTGVRRSDVVKLGRQMETVDGYIRLVETKGRKQSVKVTELTIQPELRIVLNLHLSKTNLTYIVTESGSPFTHAGFGNWFRDRCDEAGLTHCSAHGLRKAGATIAADAGATEHQLMAMYGWANPSQAALYTKRANRKKLAGQASKFVTLTDQSGNESVPLQKVVGQIGAKNRDKSNTKM